MINVFLRICSESFSFPCQLNRLRSFSKNITRTDKKYVENLPIGLFGDFYSQELSFFLINKNDHKNLLNILFITKIYINKVFYNYGN